jgi:hypothetical protein
MQRATALSEPQSELADADSSEDDLTVGVVNLLLL